VEEGPNFCHLVVFAEFASIWKCSFTSKAWSLVVGKCIVFLKSDTWYIQVTTWHACKSLLYMWHLRDNSFSNPTIQIVREVESAHNGTTYLGISYSLAVDSQPIHIIDNKYIFDTRVLNILEKSSQASIPLTSKYRRGFSLCKLKSIYFLLKSCHRRSYNDRLRRTWMSHGNYISAQVKIN
jgi:hypothetical protein